MFSEQNHLRFQSRIIMIFQSRIICVLQPDSYMQLVAPRVVANAVRTVMKNCKICFQVSFFIAIIF